MCLLFIAYGLSQKYRLVVAANRDEFLKRPTASLDFLDNKDSILGGKDLLGGGTWLGISNTCRFGAITNFREGFGRKIDSPSRGEIISDFLASTKSAKSYLSTLSRKSHQYEGFNLILGDREALYYYSNKLDRTQKLKNGFYGLSNHLLNTEWPKVKRGRLLLRPYMVGKNQIDVNAIFTHLRDDLRPDDRTLPETGVGLDWERLLGTIFIDGVEYGTRSSAVLTVSYKGEIDYTEKTYHRSRGAKCTSTVVNKRLNVYC